MTHTRQRDPGLHGPAYHVLAVGDLQGRRRPLVCWDFGNNRRALIRLTSTDIEDTSLAGIAHEPQLAVFANRAHRPFSRPPPTSLMRRFNPLQNQCTHVAGRMDKGSLEPLVALIEWGRGSAALRTHMVGEGGLALL